MSRVQVEVLPSIHVEELRTLTGASQCIENTASQPISPDRNTVSSPNVSTPGGRKSKRRRETDYTSTNQGEYTSSPEPVPNHQILPSQKEAPTPRASPPSNERPSLPWGSDPSFGPTGYNPHPDTPTHELMEHELTETYFNFVDFSVEFDTEESHNDSPDIEVSKQKVATSSDEVPSSRRRLQHIVSERNRRTQQSRLYDEICDLVPGVSINRYTKREVLMRTADWLANMAEGNKNLREQLDTLRGASP